MNLSRKDRWNPKPHCLPEDMAQRQRVEKTQRMNQPFITHIAARGISDGLHAGKDISMRMNDALGLPRRARGEQNLQRRVVRKLRDRTGFLNGKRSHPILKTDPRPLTL